MPEFRRSGRIRANGGEVHFCAATQRTGNPAWNWCEPGTSIPPYDHSDIIAGQGTAALELVESEPGLEMLIAPVGGGGLISGAALVASERHIQVFAAEPAGAADTAASVAQGQRVDSWQPDTIADGLRALVGERNFVIIQQHVNQVLTVSDDEIRAAMRQFWRHTRMLIEPSSAVVIAAVVKYPGVFSGRKVGAIITGANIHPADWIALAGTSA
jgi:threonine dehydratase